MSLQELKEQARNLSVSDHLELVRAVIESIQEVSPLNSNRNEILAEVD